MAISNERLKSFEGLITYCRKIFPPPPILLGWNIENYLDEIDILILANRAPRFLIFGESGVGKSSLINAIFGANVSSQAASNLSEKSTLDRVGKTCPDVALFLYQANQENGGIDRVLEIAEKTLKEIKNIHQRNVPLIGVVTQCDRVEPYIHKLPTSKARKNPDIETAVFALKNLLATRDILAKNLVNVIPVAAYAEYHTNGLIESDFRWNIDQLFAAIFEKLPTEAKNEMVRLTKIKKYQKSVAKAIVKSRILASSIVAGAPIPIPDAMTIPLIQVVMVTEIAYISGENWSLERSQSFLAKLGLGTKENTNIIVDELIGQMRNLSVDNLLNIIFQTLPNLIFQGTQDYLISNFLSFLPGLGNIMDSLGAAEATDKIGKAAIAYFIDKIAIEKVKRKFDSSLA
ncbi:hypothetical protein [Floridanema evergladense]|uniref:G domain-containing protein n=1 Tax=Floridaenema evergladense BLCC-F167 TaxID=3153639 RepID=A0ABV4WM96_9CYAN